MYTFKLTDKLRTVIKDKDTWEIITFKMKANNYSHALSARLT